MIKFSWRVGVSCWVVGLLVSSALAQNNPTLKLIPVAAFTQKCLGGPDEGLPCGTTANCEFDDSTGVLHPECQRVCGAGPVAGEPCSSSSDCQVGVCEQQCFCNRWITTVPLIIPVQIRGTNWSPQGQRLRTFQVSVDMESACDAIIPFGWERPCDPTEDIDCSTDEDCGGLFPVCGAMTTGVCQGINHAPECFAFICSTPSPCTPRVCPNDYVFLGRSELAATDTASLTFRYASVLLTLPGIPFSQDSYFGTLTLAPRPDGCGTVTIGLQSPPISFMKDENALDIGPLDLEGLTIVMDPCPITGIVSSEPARCSIDGRQGSKPDLTMPAGGWTSAVVKLNTPNAAGVVKEDFTMREFPGAAIGIVDTAVPNVPVPGKVTLTFPPTRPGVWTCIKFKSDDAGEVCLGGLPGDAGLDGTAEAADVPLLVDCLTGVACTPQQCDMDRSGVCGASDLVRQLDLLNKAEGYSTLSSTLPECPNPNPDP